MKKYVFVVLLILLVLSLGGCLDSPSPPGLDRPEMFIDYDEGTDESIMYLRKPGVGRFDNITLSLEREEEEEKVHLNDSFSLEERTELSKFHLEIFTSMGDNRYTFNATFEVKPDMVNETGEEDYEEEERIIFKITYYDEEEEYIRRKDLPFTTTLDLKEEETT